MASVYNRGTRSRQNWWVGWIDRSARHRAEKVGPDRALAVRVAKKIEADQIARQHGVETEPPPCAPRFDEAADQWIAMRGSIGADGRPAFRSWRDDRTRLKLHLRPRLGRKFLDEISIDDVRTLIEELRPTLRAQTIRNVLHVLSRLYEDQPKAM